MTLTATEIVEGDPSILSTRFKGYHAALFLSQNMQEIFLSRLVVISTLHVIFSEVFKN